MTERILLRALRSRGRPPGASAMDPAAEERQLLLVGALSSVVSRPRQFAVVSAARGRASPSGTGWGSWSRAGRYRM